MDIGEVAARSGLAPSALRYYEKKGLITSVGRNGLRRTFAPNVLERLALITCARSAGFTIAEIQRFVGASPGDGAGIAAKIESLDEDIARLIRMRDSLRHALTCDHEPLVECPEFKQALRSR